MLAAKKSIFPVYTYHKPLFKKIESSNMLVYFDAGTPSKSCRIVETRNSSSMNVSLVARLTLTLGPT